MARNGSGTYSLVSGNPVVTGTTISSTVHNNTMTDIATALTDSIAKNGETVITGNIDFNGNNVVDTGTINSDDTTDSTSGTTGSIQTDGGIGAVKDIVTDATVKALGDTAAGDNAAMGYTSTEGLILTGQGSTYDVTVKNDADEVVAAVPTGTKVLVKPEMPAFLAILATDMTNATGNGTTAKVTFESEIFDRGGDYDNATNYNFTAPVTGLYHFDVQVTLYNVATTADNIDLALVTSNRSYNFEIDATNSISFTASGDIVHNLSVLADMDAADTAHVNITITGIGADSAEVRGSNNKTFFSGHLVG